MLRMYVHVYMKCYNSLKLYYRKKEACLDIGKGIKQKTKNKSKSKRRKNHEKKEERKKTR